MFDKGTATILYNYYIATFYKCVAKKIFIWSACVVNASTKQILKECRYTSLTSKTFKLLLRAFETFSIYFNLIFQASLTLTRNDYRNMIFVFCNVLCLIENTLQQSLHQFCSLFQEFPCSCGSVSCKKCINEEMVF